MTEKIIEGTRHRPGARRGKVLAPRVSGALCRPPAACGGGGGGAGKVQDGFTQAKQSGGTLTVWVDSTRLAAAQLYQKQHPEVKMDIVTYDGDANGSNYLQTKVSLFNRTGRGWPDVVFSSQNNEASWAVPAGLHRPVEQGPDPAGDAGRLGDRRQRPVHRGRHAVLPAQRPVPDGAVVQRRR